MAKESCWNCSTKLPGQAAFCPTCGQPTRHASDADRLDFDLRTWREHVANGGSAKPSTRVVERPVAAHAPRTPAANGVAANGVAANGVAANGSSANGSSANGASANGASARETLPKPRRSFSLPKVRFPKVRIPALSRNGNGTSHEVVLDLDDPFAYRACATCGETDWILRGTRNDDGTFNYWCVRCSRSFKTSMRLSHGPKPFVAAGFVLAFLVGMLALLG